MQGRRHRHKWAKLGHHVKFVSVTNGDIGHWRMHGGAARQAATAEVNRAADKVLGVETEVLPIHDGELEPTLENRRTITRLIREWKADIVISHRPWDYHPDHRYVGVLVQDAAFMVTVPFFCPDTPPLTKNPVFMYLSDGFQKPYPFRPDVVVSHRRRVRQEARRPARVGVAVLRRGANGSEELVRSLPPASDVAARKAWLRANRLERQNADVANRYRDELVKWYGPEKGKAVQFAEAFELCEYGRRPSPDELAKLFPFVK